MSSGRHLRIDAKSPYRQLVGVGGVGTGAFFELEGEHTLGRNESRLGRLRDVRDYCKLHIVLHYVAKLLGAGRSQASFRVTPIAKVGDDASGLRLIQEMTETGMETSRIQTVSGSPTLFSVCFQYPDGTGGNITTSHSAASDLSQRDIAASADLLRSGGEQLVAVAVPEVPLEVRHYFLQQATRNGSLRAASFAAAEVQPALKLGMFDLLDLVSLNEDEGEKLVGCAFSPAAPLPFVERCQDLLRTSFPDLTVVVSAGKMGAFGITAQRNQYCPAPAVKVASTAGAGDSLLGGIVAGLAAGIPFFSPDAIASGQTNNNVIDSALKLGVLLGSHKCESPHTIHPHASLDTLIEFANGRQLRFSREIEALFVADKATRCPQQVL